MELKHTDFVHLMGEHTRVDGYMHDGSTKEYFKRHALAFLRQLAKDVGLAEGTYDVRFNTGGIAVSGDATLHHEHVYISFNADGICPGILYRTCKGRKDYSGGVNRWQDWVRLVSTEGYTEFVETIKQLVEREG
jgi:hypothetical protein